MKEEKHANKRNQIIASTLKLIGEVGYEKASIRAICESASISIGTFYHYFKDKGDLLDTMLRGIDDYLEKEVRPLLSNESESENLKFFAVSFAGRAVSTGALYGGIISNSNVPLPSTPEERAAEMGRALYRIPEGIIAQGQENGEFSRRFHASETASYLIMCLRGCAMDWARRGYSYNLTDYVERFMDLFTASLTAN